MKKPFPLFKWTFFGVLVVFAGVIIAVACLSHIQRGGKKASQTSSISNER